MKILHITKDDFSGAGLCCMRIHKSLLEIGIDSKVIVERKRNKVDGVYQYGHYRQLLYRAINKLLRKVGITHSDYNEMLKLSEKTHVPYTLPTSKVDLSKHPLVKEADVIHLHWVNGYVDYPSFFATINKPIVWTLHDENLFYGISQYSNSYNPDNSLEIKYNSIKINSLKQIKNLAVIFLSNYLYNKFADNSRIKDASKYIIHNSVDCSIFKPKDKLAVRNRLGIGNDTIVLLFMAYMITDPRKGLVTLLKAVKILGGNIKILAVGITEGFEDEKLITTGLITDVSEMSDIISAADYFVMPSQQEAFAQTPLEAMACGIPAIVFPVSGTEELIQDINGVRCEGFALDDLLNGLRKAFSKKYDANEIRMYVKKEFSPSTIAGQYVSVYKDMVTRGNII